MIFSNERPLERSTHWTQTKTNTHTSTVITKDVKIDERKPEDKKFSIVIQEAGSNGIQDIFYYDIQFKKQKISFKADGSI